MKADTYTSVGVKVLRGNNISDTHRLTDEFVFVSDSFADELHGCLLYPGDLFFPHRGSIGRIGIVPSDKDRRYMMSSSLMKLSCHPEKASSHFLFYYFRSVLGRDELLKRASTVGTPGIGQPLASLKSISVPLPPLSEQLGIVAVLQSLNDKIEANRRMSATLEALARALFKSWFVDFEPVHAKMEGRGLSMAPDLAALFPTSFDEHGVPAGWNVQSLYDSANFTNGAAYKDMHFSHDRSGLPVIKIAELKAGVTDSTRFTHTELAEKYRIDTADILFSWSGNPDTSIDTFVWTGGPAWLNQHIFLVQENGNSSRSFVYFLLKELKPIFAEIARNKQTTGLGHVTVADMKAMPVCSPPRSILNAFDAVADGIMERCMTCQLQTSTLATLRDLLLPKLLSGALRVGDAERLVGNAA